MTIEPMRSTDWPAVARIYEEGLDDGTFEETVPGWDEWDASHLRACRVVARNGDELVGWAALSPVSRRPCYRGVAEGSVYVARNARGQGVGRALLEELCRQADRAGLWTIQAVMFADNAASIALHESCGFRLVGRRERIARKKRHLARHGAARPALSGRGVAPRGRPSGDRAPSRRAHAARH